MNIYILTEITSRELDSNLLMAILAANRGSKVIISNTPTFKHLIKNKLLNPGIFHTKSLVHDAEKQKFHEELKKNGMKITSLDEENGIIKSNLDSFIRTRFTDEAIKFADKIFCWGKHDYESLINFFPQHHNKFLLTGSSRADMWKEKFTKYWKKQDLKKNQILISLNFPLVNGYIDFKKIINRLNKAGYFVRSKDYEKEFYQIYEVTKKNFDEFKNLIPYLSEKLKNYEIVVKPHPNERKETWKKLFNSYKNVYISNSSNFNEDLNSCSLLIHNSCTTAFQATMIKKPVISYEKNDSNLDHGEVANKLGLRARSKEELVKYIIEINKIGNNSNFYSETEKILNLKIFSPNNDELSSNLIVNAWEKLGSKLKFKKNNINKIKIGISVYEFKKNIKKNIYNFFSKNNFSQDYKFIDYKKEDLENKISKIKDILKINKNFNVRILSKKCYLIE